MGHAENDRGASHRAVARIRSRLTYANVMSSLAVFMVLSGGTAIALKGKNSVNSGDIINEQVKSADVRDLSLTGADIDQDELLDVQDARVQFGQGRLDTDPFPEQILLLDPNADVDTDGDADTLSQIAVENNNTDPNQDLFVSVEGGAPQTVQEQTSLPITPTSGTGGGAVEFTVFENRDPIRFSAVHCGFAPAMQDEPGNAEPTVTCVSLDANGFG